jgi:5-formyltetrahydrofolate cyclo-ligase
MRENTRLAVNPSRTILRRELRSGRNSLSSAIRARHDEAIGRHLLQLVQTREARSIACYWPFNGEPDITPVYGKLVADGCELALPVISGNNDNGMRFHAWRQDSELVKNRYGIPEPLGAATIPVSRFDLLIIPLVGYDCFGNRLGMGSGYYDRYLESSGDSASPLRAGVAYSLQEIDLLDKNRWDIPLHGVVNEHGWFTFARQE